MNHDECGKQYTGSMCDDATKAADLAVKNVFALLGVDVNNPISVEEFREDLRFGKKLRIASERGALAVVGVISAGAVSAVWYIVGNWFNGGK